MDDMGEESMQYCSRHPYRRNPNPGGICGFCLEEKLGKLLSSSQSIPSFFPSTSSPSADAGGVFAFNDSSSKVVASGSLLRSKSSAHPVRRKLRRHGQLFDGEEYSPRKGGFWSFLHLSSRISRESSKSQRDLKPSVHPTSITTYRTAVGGVGEIPMSSRRGDYRDENESPNSSHASAVSFGQKVARSRSVGCGSRSFSGDLLERISTGFGDCALRRVESQREVKQLSKGVFMCSRSSCGMGMVEHQHKHHHGMIKEKIKCGGILGGFSQTSSSYRASSSSEDNGNRDGVGIGSQTNSFSPRTRNKSWGWALASPMRAFKSSPKSQNKNATKTNATTPPNLAAIPALLMVGN